MWHIGTVTEAVCCRENDATTEKLEGPAMSRLTQMKPNEMTNSQNLLVDVASKLGAPDPIIASILVKSEIGRIWLRGWTEILNGGVLPVPLKELCRVLISAKHQCGYCSTVRSATAKRHGLSEEKLMAALNYESSDLFSPQERMALRFATIYLEPGNGLDDDQLYEDLKQHFCEEEIIELAIVCAETYGMGKFAVSTQVRTWEEACAIQPRLKEHAESDKAVL